MQKILALVLVVCLGSALAQDALLNMLLMRQMFSRPQMDANIAQSTNAVQGADGQPGQAGAAAADGQRPNMMRKMMLPLMMGYDLGDPMTYFLMMGGL